MKAILKKLFPVTTRLGMLMRVLLVVAISPNTFLNRFNKINISNFLKYGNQEFNCPVCGEKSKPIYDFPDVSLRYEHQIGILRETLQCRHCLASMRHRSLALGLIKNLNVKLDKKFSSIAEVKRASLENLAILDTDNFSATSNLLRHINGYTRCSYMPNQPWGLQIQPNYFNINLEKIDFKNESFDIVLTSDVMEHVRNCDSAHAEIYRILKPRGVYIFNVPYNENSQENIKLVDTSTDQDEFLCKPQMHGDPLSGGILAYRVFGRELISKLEKIGFRVEFLRIEQPSSLVINGDVFVATKSGE